MIKMMKILSNKSVPIMNLIHELKKSFLKLILKMLSLSSNPSFNIFKADIHE